MDPYLSVIVPCYNEERRISSTLVAIHTYLSTQPYSWELLLVLDGVSDGTLGVVEAFASDHAGVNWIDRKANRGKGFTVREGMLAARGEIRLFTDADNSTDISHFDKMRPLFDAGSDVVICTRDARDAASAREAVAQPLLKQVLGTLGNLFIQAVAVPGIWDTQCGFKAFTKASALRIFEISKIDRWGFDIEVLALARHFGLKTCLIAAYWIDNSETHVTPLNYLEVLGETVRVRLNLLFRRY